MFSLLFAGLKVCMHDVYWCGCLCYAASRSLDHFCMWFVCLWVVGWFARGVLGALRFDLRMCGVRVRSRMQRPGRASLPSLHSRTSTCSTKQTVTSSKVLTLSGGTASPPLLAGNIIPYISIIIILCARIAGWAGNSLLKNSGNLTAATHVGRSFTFVLD